MFNSKWEVPFVQKTNVIPFGIRVGPKLADAGIGMDQIAANSVPKSPHCLTETPEVRFEMTK